MRARLTPEPGSLLAFPVRTQTAVPSTFEMSDPPADEAGGFYFRGQVNIEELPALIAI